MKKYRLTVYEARPVAIYATTVESVEGEPPHETLSAAFHSIQALNGFYGKGITWDAFEVPRWGAPEVPE